MNTHSNNNHTPEEIQSENKIVNKSYNPEITPEIQSLLNLSDNLNNRLHEVKENNKALWPTILQKLKIEWTYNSNSIEGSTLSKGDTHFFLTEGLTIEGKPFQDFMDAKNHAEAIDFLYEVVANQRDISEGLIKEINALILSDISYTTAKTSQGDLVKKKATPGQYKTQANHVLLADGSIHKYIDPIQVQPQMEELTNWVLESIDQLHPIITASILHYNLVRIHAFDDGNGRGARILMNLVLMKKGFFPAVIKQERKRLYLSALNQADKGDLLPFISFIASELIQSQEGVISDFEGY